MIYSIKFFFTNLPSYIHRCLNLKYLFFYIQKTYRFYFNQEKHKKIVEDFLSKNPNVYEIVGLEIENIKYETEDPRLSFFENKLYKINRDLHWDSACDDFRLLFFLKTKKHEFAIFLKSLEYLKPQEIQGYKIYMPKFWRSSQEYNQFKLVRICKVLQKKNLPGPSFLKPKEAQ